MITRAQRQLTDADIERIANTYNTWRSRDAHENYEDVAGFCKAATLNDIRGNSFILTPGRYVGLEQTEDPNAEPAEQKIARLTAELLAELDRGRELEEKIRLMLDMDA
jgi:type I restriction-modification system DNA methylase